MYWIEMMRILLLAQQVWASWLKEQRNREGKKGPSRRFCW